MPQLSASIRTKLPKVSQSIFTIMSKLAAKENALNLSQGFPDFDCAPPLVQLAQAAYAKGENQYAPMEGLIELREAIAKKTYELYSGEYHPESEITITAGATQAIFTAILATINEGDEVIVFTPAYDCYEPAIELAGGKTVFIKMSDEDYRIDWEQVKKLINHRTKMMIINTPHNPSGSILSSEDLLKLSKLTANSDILILSDEVYEHIIYDGYEHQSVARFPELAARSFIISSFGKTYHTTGWKIGYCLAPSDLMKEFRKTHQYNVFSVNRPLQAAFANFLSYPEYFLGLKDFYQQKRDLFASLLAPSKFKILPTAGTYFQLIDYSGLTDEKDIDFAKKLTIENKIASIPTSVFYNQSTDLKRLRFCFAKENHTLEQAAAILCQIN